MTNYRGNFLAQFHFGPCNNHEKVIPNGIEKVPGTRQIGDSLIHRKTCSLNGTCLFSFQATERVIVADRR